MSKLQQASRPYSPEPTPENTKEPIYGYVQRELQKIESTLIPITENFQPNIMASMNSPTQPAAIGLTAVPITAWDGIIISNNVDKLATEIDPLTGEMRLGGPGDQNVTLFIWAGVNIGIDEMAQNNTIYLGIVAGPPGAEPKLLGSLYKASVQQDEAALGGTFLVSVPNDSILYLVISSTAAFNADWLSGNWGVEMKYSVRTTSVASQQQI